MQGTWAIILGTLEVHVRWVSECPSHGFGHRSYRLNAGGRFLGAAYEVMIGLRLTSCYLTKGSKDSHPNVIQGFVSAVLSLIRVVEGDVWLQIFGGGVSRQIQHDFLGGACASATLRLQASHVIM